MGVRTSFRQGLLCAAAIITTMAMPADTLALEQAEFTIEAAPLGDALRAFSQQSGRAILFSEGTVSGITAPRLTGTYEPEAALTLLLQGTGLEFTQGPNGNLIVRRQTGADPVQTPEPGRGRGREVSGEPDPETDSRRIETITVTGTSIRGIAPESSPLFVFDREEILSSGLTTTEQFIRSVPQLFGGGPSEFVPVSLPNDPSAGENNTAGSSANLRGLGSRGTLVLLNGHRLAPTSQVGDFVDLSLIPMSALARIDILPDGASSIYGGDAVAGVVNFVLRDDFEGAETSIRYGSVTRGNLAEIRLSHALGTSWDSGNILATYEYFDRDRLRLSDRPDIDVFPPRLDSLVMPDREDYFLLPAQERHSAVVSARQRVNRVLSLNATTLYSYRGSSSNRFNQSGTLTSQEATTESTTFSVGADLDLTDNWHAMFSSTRSQIDNWSDGRTLYRADGGPLTQIEMNTASSLWSVDGKIDGNLFQLPAGPVKVAVGAHYRYEELTDEQVGLNVRAAGSRNVRAAFGEAMVPLVSEHNALPGVRSLIVNLSGRAENYSDFGTSISPKIGLAWAPIESFRLRGSYSSSFAPPALGRAFSLSRRAFIGNYSATLARIGAEVPDPRLEGTGQMTLTGTQQNLDPETSRTFTIGFDADFTQDRHSWSIGGTYYNIEFEDRLGAVPLPFNLSFEYGTLLAWDDPSLFPENTIIFFPTAAQIEEALASLQVPLVVAPGMSLDNVGVLERTLLIRNLATTKTDGVDVQINYEYALNTGSILIGINANYINSFTEQATDQSPAVGALNTLYKPVDLQLRGNVGYRRGDFSGNLFINHVGGYRTDDTADATPISSWTTLDMTLSYDLGRRVSYLRGTRVAASINNLLDSGPPRAPAAGGNSLSGYDPTNASPLGRFIALDIRSTF